MACEIANSPFDDSLLNDDWHKFSDQSSSLDAIAEFNVNFGNGDDSSSQNTIDPQLTFGNTTTTADVFNNIPAFENAIGLDQNLSPQPTYEAYPQSDFTNNGPYYHSIEQHHSPIPAQMFHASPSRGSAFRRSVSEPPGGMPMHHSLQHGMSPRYLQQQQQQAQPPIMFHRDNHYLGKPIQQKSMNLKSLPKTRTQQRQHPYQRPKARAAQQTAEQQQQQQFHHLQQQQRRGPVQAPTSAPLGAPPPPHFMHREPERFVPTSRVCTPTPEPEMRIDPLLRESATPVPVAIPVTVEQLRAMIFEAVHNAVGGEEGRAVRRERAVEVESGEGVVDGHVEEVMEAVADVVEEKVAKEDVVEEQI